VVTQSGTSDDLAKALLDGFAHLIGDFINAIGHKRTHAVQQRAAYSTTSSARASRVVGEDAV